MTKAVLMPSAKFIRDLFNYDPRTGVVLWRYRPVSSFKSLRDAEAWNSRYANTLAGQKDAKGYIRIAIAGHGRFLAHRLIYKWLYGDEPAVIDHIDGNPENNKPDNLRSVSMADNTRNSATSFTNRSGRRGVRWDTRDAKWRASITVGGKFKHIGTFERFDDAVAARIAAEQTYGFHDNHGRKASLSH